MTTATHPGANGDRTAVIQAQARQRTALRRWVPQSQHFRENLKRWRDKCATQALAGYCRCGYCGKPNSGGQLASAFLHWDCYRTLLPYDAREAQHEADSNGGGARHVEPKGRALLATTLGLTQPIPMTVLVLVAWAARPDLFGLPGAEAQSASDSRVRTTLYGPRGLIRLGYVAVEGDAYIITPAGRALAGGKGVGR
jgi:hypothetical protein